MTACPEKKCIWVKPAPRQTLVPVAPPSARSLLWLFLSGHAPKLASSKASESKNILDALRADADGGRKVSLPDYHSVQYLERAHGFCDRLSCQIAACIAPSNQCIGNLSQLQMNASLRAHDGATSWPPGLVPCWCWLLPASVNFTGCSVDWPPEVCR